MTRLVLCIALIAQTLLAETLSSRTLHLRSGAEREWSEFPESAQGPAASIAFESRSNASEYSLILRQRDVKARTWTVSLNGQALGVLQDDERSMLRILPVPAGTLRSGSNELRIAGEAGAFSDDIEIADVRLEPLPVSKLLTQATVDVAASEAMPLKLTVADARGSLVPLVSLRQGAYEAARTGVLYTADGRARIGLPAGDYRVYASRGFEYSAPHEDVRLKAGSVQRISLQIRREVNLSAYISCDPHVHTFELSRHGDASVDERVLTAAGEGLDLIIATEHNRVDDYSPFLARRGLDRWTFAVPGNEVTTAMGHFNIFPARPGTPQPDPRASNWSALMDSIARTEGVKVVVQNHPRDLHSAYRPFDPAHHLSSTGSNLQSRPLRANAMEVINSGAMYSDPLQVVRDWLGLLTRGVRIAAIGSSDTHTVDFVPIGQARTYISASDSWRRDMDGTFSALAEGRNLVSYGLAAELRVMGPASKGRVPVDVAIHGPSWSSADRVIIFSNGQVVWEDSFPPIRSAGVKYRRTLDLPLPEHDTALAAVATGPGVLQPFWEVRKPYQPLSKDWTPQVMGVSSAVWVDVDNDGTISAPRVYAQSIVQDSAGDFGRMIEKLAGYDRSVSLHALDLLRERISWTRQ